MEQPFSLARWRAKPEMRGIAALWCLATLLFILPHAAQDSWDFQAYVLNGEYWFAGGSYFEPLRPPLMPFVIGLLDALAGRAFAEYAFIALASALFATAAVLLARALGFRPVLFYALSLNITIFSFGLINGTELLTIAFLELALAGVLQGGPAGFYLALAALSRYTVIGYLPLLLLCAKPKKIMLNLLLFGLALLPWLLYNLIAYGNMFLSIADHYAMNIYFREYLVAPMQAQHFIEVANLLLPLALIGLGSRLRALVAFQGKWQKHRATFALLFITIMTVFIYATTPVKYARYLFLLFLPVAVWAYDGIRWCFGRKRKAVTLLVAVLLVMNSVFAVQRAGQQESTDALYLRAIDDVRNAGYGDCSVASNGWVPLNYHGLLAQDAPRKELLNATLAAEEIVILFPHIGEPDYARDAGFLRQFPVIAQNERHVILGKGCNQPHPNDAPYVWKLANATFALHGYRTEDRPCSLLFKNQLFSRLCENINMQPRVLMP
jgi:hypothetical protein